MPLTITATETGSYEPHEADEWYDGTISDIEETDGQWGAGLKFIIHLDDDTPYDDGNPRETWAFCSQKLSPRSKLYGWLKGLGHDIEAGETVDLNQFIGSRCQVMFEIYDGYDDGGNVVEKEKVAKIRAPKTAAKPAARKAPAKKPVEDDEAPF